MVKIDARILDPSCGCDEEGDKGLCYVEGVVKDYTGEDLHENVWFSMKPPRHVGTTPSPYVSARNVEVTRAELTGKVNRYKTMAESAKTSGTDKNVVNMEARKAGVKFVTRKGT